MLTVKEAAKQVGVCESLIYGWCADGTLAHYRLGRKSRGKILILESDLMAFLNQNRVEKQPEPLKAPACKFRSKHIHFS